MRPSALRVFGCTECFYCVAGDEGLFDSPWWVAIRNACSSVCVGLGCVLTCVVRRARDAREACMALQHVPVCMDSACLKRAGCVMSSFKRV